MYEGESVGRGWVGWSSLSRPRYRPPTPMVYQRNPFKNESDQKKSWQKIAIAFHFTKEIPLKFFGKKKKKLKSPSILQKKSL